mmetsp:Transcript_36065/g.90688  ORF Transcript_36065/g.90688 Transcript_36065/m.90688 type:complete len:167 (-) Transcript_36065:857-1357(-)
MVSAPGGSDASSGTVAAGDKRTEEGSAVSVSRLPKLPIEVVPLIAAGTGMPWTTPFAAIVGAEPIAACTGCPRGVTVEVGAASAGEADGADGATGAVAAVVATAETTGIGAAGGDDGGDDGSPIVAGPSLDFDGGRRGTKLTPMGPARPLKTTEPSGPFFTSQYLW